ncbi:amidohydrolase family protein [Polluticoccus soli]|uniref:amidohydrolase family protein n=1 Tax=Polluticoccus soli TaxID=3034150 RepID=UPI0023E23DC9|nr:amidohydrolase family protein [Flavipsychrobacter sp. JY13-12]
MLLTADKIHDGHRWLPAGTVVEVDDAGNIVALHAHGKQEAQFFDGVLCPGFVNTHCHLELSHLKGKIPERTGLVSFLQQVMALRPQFDHPEQRVEARRKEFHTMYENGIVAVGDISNTNDTLDIRGEGKVHFHTFVESIGFTETPQKQFAGSTEVHSNFTTQASEKVRLVQSIVPHAPYTVSHVLFRMIDKHDTGSLISIHNQESPAEDDYYFMKKGGMQTLLHGVGINDDFFVPSGKSSLQTYLEWMSPTHPFLFVHNTYTKRNDVEVAKTLLPELSWCLCPGANLYIEDALPDIGMFIQEGVKICIGTDSLASNHQLCILTELSTIKQHYPNIEWAQLLRWGTYNGAHALQMDDLVGTIAPGMQPGILQLQGLDSDQKPTVKRII